MKRFTLKVQEIKHHSFDALTLCFKQPGIRKVKYKAGQYITLISNIAGRKYARPYSFSSAPSKDVFLEITVKRVKNGIFSNHINDNAQVGDTFEVIEPMGDFIYDYSNTTPAIFLWGVGSGITPLFSIIKEALNNCNFNTKLFLIYGNKNKESILFNDELEKLEIENSNNFTCFKFFSKDDSIKETNKLLKGRINSNFINKLSKQFEGFDKSKHYICGPNELKETITSTLLQLNVPKSYILTESYELVIDPKDFFDVKDSTVNINFQGLHSEIFVPKGKSILDIALDNNIDIPYSCQIGNCSSCKAKVNDGQLKMLGLTKERDDLAHDEFLLCCSYPLTNNINLEIS